MVKFLIILLLYFTLCDSQQFPVALDEDKLQACIRRHVTGDEDLETVKSHCMGKCVLENMGLLKDGKVQVDGGVKFYKNFDGEEAELRSILEDCDSKATDDSCDTGNKIAECFVFNIMVKLTRY